jgi:hypothetical protein
VIDSERIIEDGKVPVHKVEMKIVAGTNASQVGKVIYHRINLAKAVYGKGEGEGERLVDLEPLTPGARKNLFKFFIGIGLLKESDIEGKEKVKLPFGQLLGRQAIVEIKNEPYKDRNTDQMKDSFRIPYGCNVWTLDDEKMKHVPRDPESLAMIAAGGGVGNIDDI